MTSHDGHTINVGYPTIWRIEQRGDFLVAVNATTGEVWESHDLYPLCFAMAAGGNDAQATADWLRYLASRIEDEQEVEAAHNARSEP